MAKAELLDHPKFRRFRQLLDVPVPYAWGLLECMWRIGYQTGNPVLGDSMDVELAAQWPGEPGKFTAAASDLQVRFLEKSNGIYVIHDLYEHAPIYAQKRMQRCGKAPAEWYEQNPDFVVSKKLKDRVNRRKGRKPLTDGNTPPIDNTELIAAIADVTHNDPATDERRFNRACKVFNKAGYGAKDVRLFGREYHVHCPEARGKRDYPDTPELVRKIGRMRHYQKRRAAADERARKRRQDESERDAQLKAEREEQEREEQEQQAFSQAEAAHWFAALGEPERKEIEDYTLTRFEAKDRIMLIQPKRMWPPMLARKYERERENVIRTRMNLATTE